MPTYTLKPNSYVSGAPTWGTTISSTYYEMTNLSTADGTPTNAKAATYLGDGSATTGVAYYFLNLASSTLPTMTFGLAGVSIGATEIPIGVAPYATVRTENAAGAMSVCNVAVGVLSSIGGTFGNSPATLAYAATGVSNSTPITLTGPRSYYSGVMNQAVINNLQLTLASNATSNGSAGTNIDVEIVEAGIYLYTASAPVTSAVTPTGTLNTTYPLIGWTVSG